MKNRLVRFNKHRTSGFTLFELLVAIAISGISLSLAGTAVVTIMQSQQKSATEVSQRTNLNRALDFMADEVRMSKSIASTTTNLTVACGTATQVFNLTLPDRKVTYFVGCASNPWAGPKAIYRQQQLNSSPSADAAQILVDGIRDPSPFSCTKGDKYGSNGAYICLINSRTVSLHLYGKLTDAYGNEMKTASGNEIQTYPVSSQVTARSQ